MEFIFEEKLSREDYFEKSDDEEDGVPFDDRVAFADKVRKLNVE